ncbi:MAG: exonuclease SbcCD subunit D C-terminal domain-containing protein, partial [Rectinemataceae bacterium]
SHGAFEIFRQRSGRAALQGGDSEETPRKRLCQQAYFDTIMEMIQPLRSRYSCNVLAAHCYVAGAQISETETSYIGGAEAVSAETFAGFDYVALGHLHRMQEIAPGIHYSGAPHAMDFSEGEQQKGMLHVELTMEIHADKCNEPSNSLKKVFATDIATTVVPQSAGIDSQSGTADHPPYRVTQITLHPLHRLKRLRGSLEELLRRGDGLDQPDEDYIEAYLTDERQIHHAFDDLIKVYPNMLGLRWDVLERKFATMKGEESDTACATSGSAGDAEREMTSRDRCIQHFRAFTSYIKDTEPDEDLMETFLSLLDEEVQA